MTASNGLSENPTPFLADSRVLVFGGHFGSGKTEVSLNIAVALATREPRLALVDLDIVNPFFRSAEQEDLLRENGVTLYKPIYAATNVDIPSLPPEILGVFAQEDLRVIFDVGGDDIGAAALGAYAPQFARCPHTFYMVVNPYRPRSCTVGQIVEHYAAISARARMRPDALVCNANLGRLTARKDVEEGLETVRAAARDIGVPVAFCCAEAGLAEQLAGLELPVLPITRYLKPEWEEP